jgi:Ca-activated chloride channel family protein
MPTAEGIGPGQRGDQHSMIVDNPLRRVIDEPLSTFSIDVDTAAYSKLRSLLNSGEARPPLKLDWLRVEEMINYFGYDYPAPRTGEPYSLNIETAACPWSAGRRLVRIGLKGREIDRRERPAGNFVFLLDVSGSMEPPNRLPLVLEGMRLLTKQLDERDRVAIVVYAGASGLVLPSTPATHEGKQEILSALSRLHSGGSTNGAAGIELAYQMAQDHFIKGGANRVILCTDGDFNVGVTSPDRLESLITEKAKTGVFLTTLGFGMGNHNDAMLEKLADKGNGVYGDIDTIDEAKKLFVEELSGTLVTVAKDVKIQVEFNPVHVAAYRLIGYENRILAKEDFNDDKKDAGEIGAGHSVTALYEIVPATTGDDATSALAPKVDDLEFQKPGAITDSAKESGQMLVVKLRYKEPDGDVSKLIKVGVKDDGKDFSRASVDFKFAAAVASFGMLLRDSPHKGSATLDAVLEIARSALGEDKHGYRAEFTRLVEQAKTLSR